MHTQRILINFYPNEYSQGSCCYPSAVNLDRYVGGCNTLNDLSNRVCVPDKTADLGLHIFSIITGINESKTLAKHLSCKCECKFNGKKRNSNQKWNNNKCWHECKILKKHACEKHVVVKMANI